MKFADTNLFDRLPDALFGPLASPRKRLYWQVLTRLYWTLFDEDADIGDYGHSRVAVVDAVDAVLSERPDLWISDEAEGDAVPSKGESLQRARANLVYYTLRRAGWLEEERRGYHDYVTLPPRVGQCLAMLLELAEGRALILTGKLKSFEAGMRQVLSAPESQADTLTELAKDARRFARHLSSIRGAIKGLYDQIRGNLSSREIVAAFFDDFLRDIFIRDYAAIKTSENPLRIRDELLRIVSALRYSSDIKPRLLAGYERLYAGKDSVQASVHLDQDLSRLEQVFYNIERQLDAIDTMKVRYEQRIDTVIDYATRTPRSFGRDLKRLAAALVRHGERNPQATVRLPVTFIEGFGEVRLAKPKQTRPAPTPRTVKASICDPGILARSEQERAARLAVRVDEDALSEFLAVQMGTRRSIGIGDIQVRGLRDYFCVLALRRAARAQASAAREYPAVMKRYSLKLSDAHIETEYFRMGDITINRKGVAA